MAPRQYAHLPYAHFLCSRFMLIICEHNVNEHTDVKPSGITLVELPETGIMSYSFRTMLEIRGLKFDIN
jgi:hypothetical protein